MSHNFQEGIIYHKRYLPKKHQFTYKFFMIDIDINNFETLENRYFSYNKWNLFSFHSKDHFGVDKDFKKNIQEILEKCDMKPTSHMRFITLPSILGYVFNPISILVLLEKNIPVSMIAEVHNYNGGRAIYPLKLDTKDNKHYKAQTLKDMYVSPFFKNEGDYTFNMIYDYTQFSISIELFEENKKMLTSTFVGKTKKFSQSAILKLFLKHTLLTFWVVTRTIWQSLKLKLKGLKWNQPRQIDQIKRG